MVESYGPHGWILWSSWLDPEVLHSYFFQRFYTVPTEKLNVMMQNVRPSIRSSERTSAMKSTGNKWLDLETSFLANVILSVDKRSLPTNIQPKMLKRT